MNLDELLKKQANGEELTAEELAFIKQNQVMQEDEKNFSTKSTKKQSNKDEVLKNLEEQSQKLLTELERIKKEKEEADKQLAEISKAQELTTTLLTEKDTKISELLEMLGKTKEEQEQMVKELKTKEQEKKQMEAFKEMIATNKQQYDVLFEEQKKEIARLKLQNELSSVKGSIQENITSKPYFKPYYEKMLKVLSETEDTQLALEKVKTLQATMDTLLNEEEEKQKYEDLSKKNNGSIFDGKDTKKDDKKDKKPLSVDETNEEVKKFLKANNWIR